MNKKKLMTTGGAVLSIVFLANDNNDLHTRHLPAAQNAAVKGVGDPRSLHE